LLIIPCHFEANHWRLFVIDWTKGEVRLVDSLTYSDETNYKEFDLLLSNLLRVWFLGDYIEKENLKLKFKKLPKE
jgi:Ulp1 family protease